MLMIIIIIVFNTKVELIPLPKRHRQVDQEEVKALWFKVDDDYNITTATIIRIACFFYQKMNQRMSRFVRLPKSFIS